MQRCREVGGVGVRVKVTKTYKNSFSGKEDTKPENIKVRRFKVHESCNRCVVVIVSTDTPFETETGNNTILRDFIKIRGSLT